ncbi:MAG: fructose-bisphosphatase class II [Chloroflexi bacterium]|nr:fructose-bisphosphatase class II [Chloroflexota bacterium]
MFVIPRHTALDPDLAYRLLPVTEAGAAAAAFDGCGLEAMRRALESVDVSGTLVLGDPEGSVVLAGGGGALLDVALAQTEALSILVAAPAGSIRVPRGRAYLDLLVTTRQAAGLMDVAADPADNLCRLSSVSGRSMQELSAAVAGGPCNAELAARLSRVGARVRTVEGGPLVGALEALRGAGCGCGPDVFLGLGSAADAIACASAALCLDGELQARSPACGGPTMLADDVIRSEDVLLIASASAPAGRLDAPKLTDAGAAVHSLFASATAGRLRQLKRTVPLPVWSSTKRPA